jgi:hypothetical protein
MVHKFVKTPKLSTISKPGLNLVLWNVWRLFMLKKARTFVKNIDAHSRKTHDDTTNENTQDCHNFSTNVTSKDCAREVVQSYRNDNS